MQNNQHKTPLLDRNYHSLSLQDKNTYLKLILAELLESSALSGEAKDALEVFDEYSWKPKADAHNASFYGLAEAGCDGQMNEKELNLFLDMVTDNGEAHLYFYIRKGTQVFSEDNHCENKSKIKTPAHNSQALNDYFVSWEINESARTPQEAAQIARQRQIKPGTQAVVFRVFDEDGNETKVDLLEKQESKPLGLEEALNDLADDDDSKLYECEIGLYDLENDPNTPMETHIVVVAAWDAGTAISDAQLLAEKAIPVVNGIAFAPTDKASEISPDAYKES